MAAIARTVGPALHFLTRKQVSTSLFARGYADMPFTLAAGNQVCIVNREFQVTMNINVASVFMACINYV